MPTPDRSDRTVYRPRGPIALHPCWSERRRALEMFAAITGCEPDELTIEGPDDGPYTITYTAREEP